VEDHYTSAYVNRTLAFSGLLQLAYEFIRADVVDRVKGFYGCAILDGEEHWLHGDDGAQWRSNVASLDPRNEYRASIAWLIDMGALTLESAAKLERVRLHRNELAHEMAKFLVQVEYVPDESVLTDAIEVFHALDRFWIGAEVDTGLLDDFPDVSIDEVTSVTEILLGRALGAFRELPHS